MSNNETGLKAVDPEKQIVEVHDDVDASSVPQRKSFFEDFAPWSGIVYPTRASVASLLVRPFLACLTPVCLWAGLIYGVAITWLVLIATSVAQLFSASRELF